ncbi:MAG: hypothetical protein AAF569_07195 [Pseudomonadota bacterium]
MGFLGINFSQAHEGPQEGVTGVVAEATGLKIGGGSGTNLRL